MRSLPDPEQRKSSGYTEPTPDQSSSGSEIGFRSVLQGSTSFFSTDANQTLTINELGQTVSSNSSITVKAIKFAMIDLDSDNVQEVVLWLQVGGNDSYGFEILRQQGGQIYGYTLPYRAFMDLKRDGAFSFSSGAADSGFGSIIFTDKSYKIDEIAHALCILLYHAHPFRRTGMAWPCRFLLLHR